MPHAVKALNSAAACSLGPEVLPAAGRSDMDYAIGACVDGNGVCRIPPPAVLADRDGSRILRAVSLGLSPTFRPVTFPPSQCQRVQISDSPEWVTAAFWGKGSYLGLLNGYEGEISLYDLGGRLRRRVKSGGPLEAVVNYRGRLLAKGRRNVFFFLKEDLGSLKPFALPGFGSLYAGWVTNGDEIVAYGSVPIAGGTSQRNNSKPANFQLGFVRVKMTTGSASLVLPFPKNDFYRINHQYIATANGESYFLAMGSSAIIYRLPRGRSAVPLKAMPREFLEVPRLQEEFVGPDAVKQRFGQIESLRMPVGLYGQGKFVYLLTRDPEACSPWSIFKIDPTSDRVVGSVSLPSLARHLTLMPGDPHWIVIEKGVVASAGHQAVKGIQSVPASWITQPDSSPLRTRSALTNCLRGD